MGNAKTRLSTWLSVEAKARFSAAAARQDLSESALLKRPSPFQGVYDLMQAYEAGHWERLGELATHSRLPENVCPGIYLHAVQWATEVTRV